LVSQKFKKKYPTPPLRSQTHLRIAECTLQLQLHAHLAISPTPAILCFVLVLFLSQEVGGLEWGAQQQQENPQQEQQQQQHARGHRR
jgi:hypothetical protein